MDKGSPGALKVFNQKEICRTILQKGPMTRAQLAKELQLSKPTTSLNVQGLLEQHILVETSQAVSLVGKKGTLLAFHDMYHFILIVDTTSLSLQNKIRLHVCNLKGEQVVEDSITMDRHYDENQQEEIFAKYNKKINQWITNFKHPTGTICHVVLSLPGIHAMQTNQEFYFDLENKITCSISNDINLALLGEKIEQADGSKNIAYLRINQGLGAAFSINNQLYTGKNAAAGEIGYYQTLVQNGDTLESVALKDVISIYAILKEKETLGYVFDKTLHPLEDLLLGIKQKNTWCMKKVTLLYTYLENLVMNLTVTLALDEIILAGAILQLIPDVIIKLQTKVDTYPLTSTYIRPASSKQTTDIGGYHLAMEAILDHILL